MTHCAFGCDETRQTNVTRQQPLVLSVGILNLCEHRLKRAFPRSEPGNPFKAEEGRRVVD